MGGAAPEVRGYHSMALLEGPAGAGARAVVLGGRNDGGLIAGREVVAVCDLQAMRWVPPARCIAGVAPSGRSSHKCAPPNHARQPLWLTQQQPRWTAPGGPQHRHRQQSLCSTDSAAKSPAAKCLQHGAGEPFASSIRLLAAKDAPTCAHVTPLPWLSAA